MKYRIFTLLRSLKFAIFFITTLILTIAIPTANVQAWIVIDDPIGEVYYIPADQPLDKKYPVYRTLRFEEGDIIVTGANSQVILKCSKKDPGTEVTSNRTEPITNICGNSNPFLGDPTEIRRGGKDPLIPYIVSPRYTRLLTKQPTLKWNAVEGATRYIITLYREGLREDSKVWQKSVESKEPVEGVEEFSYPSDEEQLEVGADYRLVVEANNERSSQDEKIDLDDYDVERRGVSGLKFRLLGEAEVQSIQEASEKIIQGQPPSEEEVITLAFHYAKNNLYAEAIEMLNSLVKSDSQKSDIYRILGDFYAQSGLNLLAKKSYLKAIDQAKETQEVLEEALAQQDLGELYMKMHEPRDDVSLLEQAREQFEQALAKYRKLNREPKIDEITNLINQLENLEANQ
ncbi:MAG TPA: hypothetical protein DCL61_19220 [Cyanobacteria bacterium UBA12227]|nr:hypothetical protein [Cyanobacteria bacterium UBA12227]HAX89762.1 hypothetical protein [Cyanobacteria bacterium UBA11370]HBY78263.1 hypothetical protein [Cyanobacteria bacterium UBA11148]